MPSQNHQEEEKKLFIFLISCKLEMWQWSFLCSFIYKSSFHLRSKTVNDKVVLGSALSQTSFALLQNA